MDFDKISKNIIRKIKRSLKRELAITNEIDYAQMNEILKNNSNVILLDVRSVQEYKEGHINGAINIPVSELKEGVEHFIDYNMKVIVYCKAGSRSKKAVNILNKLGYKNVYSLNGGLDGISV